MQRQQPIEGIKKRIRSRVVLGPQPCLQLQQHPPRHSHDPKEPCQNPGTTFLAAQVQAQGNENPFVAPGNRVQKDCKRLGSPQGTSMELLRLPGWQARDDGTRRSSSWMRRARGRINCWAGPGKRKARRRRFPRANSGNPSMRSPPSSFPSCGEVGAPSS